MGWMRLGSLTFLLMGILSMYEWSVFDGTESHVAWIMFAIGLLGAFVIGAADYIVREVRHDIQKLDR